MLYCVSNHRQINMGLLLAMRQNNGDITESMYAVKFLLGAKIRKYILGRNKGMFIALQL